MDSNIINAAYCGTSYITTRPAWLIDYGMVLKLSGIELPDVYEVDFANTKTETATRVLGGPDGVTIPDRYFLQPNAQQIFAWLYLHTGEDDGYTKIQVTIPLYKRPDVTDVPPTPEEQSIIEQAIVALNNGVERAETAAENAEQSARDAADAVEHVEETVDTALQEAKDSGEFDGPPGSDGEKGDTGATPDITIGTVSTLEPGQPATATMTGTPENPVLNLGIPQGEKGDPGEVTQAEFDEFKGDINKLTPAATAQDVGKALIVKTVDSTTGKPSAYEYGEAGGGGDTSNCAPVIIETASGSVASFPDGADGLPVKKLTVNIEAVQEGSGDPSPTNVRPISGWTGANITRTGKNVIGGIALANAIKAVIPNAVLDTTAKTISFGPKTQNLFDAFKASTTYTFILTLSNSQANHGATNLGIVFADGAAFNFVKDSSSTIKQTIVSVQGGNSNRGSIKTFRAVSQIGTTTLYYEESGVFDGVLTASDFVPCTSNTLHINWEPEVGTVYGGTLTINADGSGELAVDSIYCKLNDFTWTLNGSGSAGYFYSNTIANLYAPNETNISFSGACEVLKAIPSATNGAWASVQNNSIGIRIGVKRLNIKAYQYASVSDMLTAIGDYYVAYRITDKTTYPLTASQITTLLGTNNIWADCGDVEVEYRADTKLYIQKINTPTDADMISDTQIASGKYFIIGNNLYLSTTTIPAGDTIIPGTNCTKTNLAEALNALNT